ncbi:MAG: B12-binding domain-containing radical SAM protein [Planctomycetota bacterium]|jgi:hypothetical protein
MDVAVVATPAASAFAPPMSILALRSYLQANGIAATPIDANIGAIHWTVEPTRFWSYVEPILPALRKGLPRQVADRVRADRVVAEGHAPGPLDEARAEEVRDALESIRTPDGFAVTKEDFLTQLSVLDDALILSSLRMFPNHLNVWNDYDGVISGKGQQHSPYLHYCRDVLVPQLIELAPDVIGLSLSHGDQVLYSIFTVHELRKRGVTTPIVVGGAHFTFFGRLGGQDGKRVPLMESAGKPKPEAAIIGSLLGALDPFTRQLTADTGSLTIGVREEGEGPLLKICQRLDAGQAVDDLDNVVHFDRQAGDLVFNKIGPYLPAEDLPATDLSGLGIGRKYISPVPVAPLMSSRGCYWDKCAFCDHAHILGQGYRMLDVDVIADSMESYQKDFGVEFVLFSDEALSPSMVRRLTDKLEEKDMVLPYGSMCRVDEGFIPLIERAAQRGLKSMCFGWESACDRIVAKMKKGYTREASERLIDECVRNKVCVQFFIMMGFPTETEAEAQETVDYLVENRDKILGVNVMPWRLTPGSYVNANWEEFGLIPQPGSKPGQDISPFVLTEGLSRPQAVQIIDRMKAHPKLQCFFAAKAFEDYKVIMDAIRIATAKADDEDE